MDILDIDEALKDDSFIFLEDKTHDDISNILQQWKCNNFLPQASNTAEKHQNASEQAYKLDSRTFTRPKRKLAQNLETQFTNNSNATQHAHLNSYQQQQQQGNANNSQNENPMFNLEIGGLVTNMQKSFLHDTSPPSFSSMDVSIDRLSNSLITSADFSNINFLQSTNSLDLNSGHINEHEKTFDFMGKASSNCYTLSDMIRDRQALESLTMSSEGTLVKDSHIGQIDDISLTLSKTASGCSTMDNSTESVESANRIGVYTNKDRTFDGARFKDQSVPAGSCNDGQSLGGRTLMVTDEMIADITCDLVENSFNASLATGQQRATLTNDSGQARQLSSDSQLSASALDETVCISTSTGGMAAPEKTAANFTFDCQQNVASKARCDTPEALEKSISLMKLYESTPKTARIRQPQYHKTPTLCSIPDINISPIVASNAVLPNNATQVINDTFEVGTKNNRTCCVLSPNSFSDQLPGITESGESIENIRIPSKTFEENLLLYEQASPASLEMRNVMDLAQAEANLLASNNNEEEFDHMLDEFSKIRPNEEQLKMRKSLDTIKKRFHYGSKKDNCAEKESEARGLREMLRVTTFLQGDDDHSSKEYLNMTMDVGASASKSLARPLKESWTELTNSTNDDQHSVKSPLKDSTASGTSISDSKFSSGLSASTASNVSIGGERLLSRRSRLYDDINISALPQNSQVGKASLNASYTILKAADASAETYPSNASDAENGRDHSAVQKVLEKTELTAVEEVQADVDANTCGAQDGPMSQYKLAEKRERDRDRFKTIKINKNRSGEGDSQSAGLKLNVPCIDDYGVDADANEDANAVDCVEEAQQTTYRFAHRPREVSPVFNNNKSEVETINTAIRSSKANTNYLTYKKPKDKLASARNLPEITPATTTASVVAVSNVSTVSKPRSISRPRVLSGLIEPKAVCKAASTDELTKKQPGQTNPGSTKFGLQKGTSATTKNNRQLYSQKPTGELKSPMGIKSKSFHNLSTNPASVLSTTHIGSFGGVAAPKVSALRRANAPSTEKLMTDDGCFKVPKMLSGLRAPGTTGNKAGLPRPSSGYYGYGAGVKGAPITVHTDGDSDTGRQSPVDSVSSTSSMGSGQNLNKQHGIKVPSTLSNTTAKTNAAVSLTKITIGSTGIPKPSGLRPPTSVKRSGLPRPKSCIKLDK